MDAVFLAALGLESLVDFAGALPAVDAGFLDAGGAAEDSGLAIAKELGWLGGEREDVGDEERQKSMSGKHRADLAF